ncbi:MAG: MoaD/ThiS family protein [Candidatus Eisenbacteria bacterium]
MQGKVLFFAQMREQMGAASAAWDLPEGSRVRDLLASLEASHPGIGPLRPHLAVAMNGELVRADTMLAAGAELALLPPVSGG